MNIIFHPKMHRYLAVFWIFICLLLTTSLFWILPRSQVTNSVLELLPKSNIVGLSPNILEKFSQRLDQQLVWFIKPHSKKDSSMQDDLSAVKWWQDALKTLPELNHVNGEISSDQQSAFIQFLWSHKHNLLDPNSESRLRDQTHTNWIMSQVYSPFSGVGTKELQKDPLLLMRGIQLAAQSETVLQFKQNWLSGKDAQGQSWYFVRAELAQSSYNMQSSQKIVQKLNALKAELQTRWPEAEILAQGTLFFSDHASQLAQKDISTIGVFSLFGVIGLLFFVFRSFKPLLLTLLSTLIGVLFGSFAVLSVFGQIHIVTIVMSTSIVGISIDYALHFLTERMVHGKQDTPLISLKKIFPALSLALISSCIAYFLLFLAPFPGLQQLAIFAIFGLSASFLTVACWYPYLVSSLKIRQIPYLSAQKKVLMLWEHNVYLKWGLPLCILGIVLIGLSQLKIDDDVRSLQELPVSLAKQSDKISTLTGHGNDQNWFIVHGETIPDALSLLKKLSTELKQLKDSGSIKQYKILPFPSEATQRARIDLITQSTPAIIKSLEKAGFTFDFNTNTKSDTLRSDQILTFKMWSNSLLSDGWKLLYLTDDFGRLSILVPVSGVQNAKAMQNIAMQNSGIYWVDKRGEFTDTFRVYRVYLSSLLGIAVVLICGVFFLRFGLYHAMRCSIPMILSLGMGLAILGLMGQTLNIFSLLALILVLGIGIDYTLFFSNTRADPSTTLLAVLMAALTTILTFGLLALSHTQAIASFGLVLCGGILTAVVLSPLAIPTIKNKL